MILLVVAQDASMNIFIVLKYVVCTIYIGQTNANKEGLEQIGPGALESSRRPSLVVINVIIYEANTIR
jgi:hypothetical protein